MGAIARSALRRRAAAATTLRTSIQQRQLGTVVAVWRHRAALQHRVKQRAAVWITAAMRVPLLQWRAHTAAAARARLAVVRVLQPRVRGWRGRQYAAAVSSSTAAALRSRTAAVRIQRWSRAVASRRRLKQWLLACDAYAAAAEGLKARLKQRAAAAALQQWHSRAHRRVLLKRSAAAAVAHHRSTALGRACRTWRRTVRAQHRARSRGALALQRLWRGHTGRAALQHTRTQHAAATTLARCWRGCTGRRRARHISSTLAAARAVQALWRGHATRAQAAAHRLDCALAAAARDRTARLSELLQRWPSLATQVRSSDGQGILHAAAAAGAVSCAKLALRRGAAVSAHDATAAAATPLHVAAGSHSYRREELVRLLLKKGADTSALDAQGRTPLLAACAVGAAATAAALLDAGAELEVRDAWGRSALHIAAIDDFDGLAKVSTSTLSLFTLS
jgi:Ankyrin repeats (3 copies)